MKKLKLGLIGGNIAASRAPYLNRLAGAQADLDVSYELLTPALLGKSFDTVFSDCVAQGYRGVNITYPYKEVAARLVQVDDPSVRAIGAVNTVIFDTDGARGFNTDYSGFVAAYRAAFAESPTGRVCMLGTGGVGRAIAFGLLTLGVRELRLLDIDGSRAATLARQLRAQAPDADIVACTDLREAAREAEGILNCTPVGMVGTQGTPLPCELMRGSRWAFDAVYTPMDTRFLGDATAQGLKILSGYELFFHQGLDAWKIFSGHTADPAQLRARLHVITVK